jgi:hypothetical protein
MTDGTAGHGRRLRDLEAEAFRTGRVLAEHSERLTTAGERQDGTSESVTRRLDAIERILSALAHAQGIDPARGAACAE